VNLRSDDFHGVENVSEFVAFEFQRFAHRGWEFFSGFSARKKLFFGLDRVFEGGDGKFGNGFHDLMIIAADVEVQGEVPRLIQRLILKDN